MATGPKDKNPTTNDEFNCHSVLTNWIQVIREFHQYCNQLNPFVNDTISFDYLLTTNGFNWQEQRTVRKHKQLQGEIGYSLSELAKEVDGGLPTLAAIQQRSQHTEPMRHWNKRIQCVLCIDPSTTA